MKILNTEQLREADHITIERQGITSWQLMERASTQLFLWIEKHLPEAQSFCIMAGVGNNGGDGLALVRILLQSGKQVSVYLVQFSEQLSADCQANLHLLEELHLPIHPITAENTSTITLQGEVIVDAIFGVGLNRPVPTWVQSVFERINSAGAYVVSVDIPSGVYTDKATPDLFVNPSVVLTFQTPKLPLLLPQTGVHIPRWEALDIGLDTDFIASLSTDFTYLTEEIVIPLRKVRNKFAHKGTFGHALLIGGSYGKIGAVVLSATAALRIGTGLVTALIPRCGYPILQTAVPEAMVLTSDKKKHINTITVPFQPSAIGVGVGLGKHPDTAEALFELFDLYAQVPFVIDADALNLLAQHNEAQTKIPRSAILTPHPKELERLIGSWNDDFEKIEKAKTFALKHSIILIVKGAHTLITDGVHCWLNSSGNVGMATGGSGDVLTGILTGLRAQGYSPLEAALLGVFEHGRRGDTTAQRIGEEALIARDLAGSCFSL